MNLNLPPVARDKLRALAKAAGQPEGGFEGVVAASEGVSWETWRKSFLRFAEERGRMQQAAEFA